MKLYRVETKNDRRWTASGALSRDFYVLAEDFMQASLNADSVLQTLKERLSEKVVDKVDLSSLTIRSVSELGNVVDGVASDYRDPLEEWLESVLSAVAAGD